MESWLNSGQPLSHRGCSSFSSEASLSWGDRVAAHQEGQHWATVLVLHHSAGQVSLLPPHDNNQTHRPTAQQRSDSHLGLF